MSVAQNCLFENSRLQLEDRKFAVTCVSQFMAPNSLSSLLSLHSEQSVPADRSAQVASTVSSLTMEKKNFSVPIWENFASKVHFCSLRWRVCFWSADLCILAVYATSMDGAELSCSCSLQSTETVCIALGACGELFWPRHFSLYSHYLCALNLRLSGFSVCNLCTSVPTHAQTYLSSAVLSVPIQKSLLPLLFLFLVSKSPSVL